MGYPGSFCLTDQPRILVKVLKYKDRSILRFLSSSYMSSNNTLITKTLRRIMKMTRAQDGGGNREEVLENWSLGTLSERPQPSVHAARVPSRSARVLLRLCFHRAQTSSLGDVTLRQYRLCHAEASLVGTESCFVLILPSVCPVPSEVTYLFSEHPKGNSP